MVTLFGEVSQVLVVQLHQHEYFPVLCTQGKEKGDRATETGIKRQEQIPVPGNQGSGAGSAHPR